MTKDEMKGKEPLTATHYCKDSHEWMRWGKGNYAEVYLSNKYWYECPTTRNHELTPDNYNPVNYRFVALYKTGFSRWVCNLRLSLIKFKYRV